MTARRLLPSPVLSLLLLLVWLLVARRVDASQILLGALLGWLVPLLMPRLLLRHVRVRRPRVVLRFIATVLVDVVQSNLVVARGVLRGRRRPTTPAFVTIPLELHDPLGLAVLAMVTTVVPGTVWSELSLDRSRLLLHVWDAPDPELFVAYYKARYEQPLREIFQ
jgi:multicomponent K+:H+ antiporter subunit E